MQLIVELTNINLISYYKKFNEISHLMISVKDFSLSGAHNFTFDEIKLIIDKIKKTHLKLAINLNRLYSDSELDRFKELSENLPLFEADMIFYSDFGLKVVLEELGIKDKLIFNAPTYLTNSSDVNLYNSMNKSVVISNEISSSELLKISSNLTKSAIADLFGKSPIFYSRRKLLTNYFKYRNEDFDPFKKTYSVIEEIRNENLPIIEDETGTHIFESGFHYLLEEIKDFNLIDYGIINLPFLSINKIKTIVNSYVSYLNDFNEDNFYQALKQDKIEIYKGAYNIKSVLLKGGAKDE